MTFDQEWADIKANVAGRQEATQMRLAGADGGPRPTPAGGPPPPTSDISLDDEPVRRKASETHTASREARKSTKLDDAEAAGKTHSEWEAGKESNACVNSWQRRLHELGDMVEATADDLMKGMNMFIGEDRSVAQEMKAVANWMERA